MARKRNLKPTDKLLESGILDSLGVLDLVAFLEQEFHVVVSDEELLPENFQTIETLIAFVQSKQNGKSGHMA
jgi:acyl carrier protein